MRVSDGKLFDMTRRSLADARSKLADKQDAATSGLRVSKPSDDPVASARARALSSDVARSDVQLRSAKAARSTLEMSDGALGDAGGILTRLGELAVQGATDTLSANDRASMAHEVTNLRASLLGLANTQAGGRYIFGGRLDGAAPFDGAGTYVGDTVARQAEVAPSVRLPTGISGDVAFAPSGGVDVFAAIDAFATALGTNDITGIRAGVGAFSGAVGQIADARGVVGASLSSVDVAVASVERAQDGASAERAGLVEIDQASALLDFLQAQQALETATTLASKLSVGELARMR